MKNKFPLIVALILGIAAVFGIQYYVKSIKLAEAAKYKGRDVVAARQSIGAGTEITENMLMRKSVPGQFIPPQAVEGVDDYRRIIGRKARTNIKSGDLVLWSDLEMEQWGGLSQLIPEGERAFTVDISAGVPSSLLQPNDRVDILGLFTLPGDPAAGGAQSAWRDESDIVCVVLLQGVSILTVGEDIATVGRQAQAGGGSLTFAVTLPEAQLLMFSSEHGTLGVALRGESEVEIVERAELGKVTYKELESVIGDLDNKRKKRVVQIMRGRTMEQVDVEGDSSAE